MAQGGGEFQRFRAEDVMEMEARSRCQGAGNGGFADALRAAKRLISNFQLPPPNNSEARTLLGLAFRGQHAMALR